MYALLKRKKAFDFVRAFVVNLIKIELLKQKCGTMMLTVASTWRTWNGAKKRFVY